MEKRNVACWRTTDGLIILHFLLPLLAPFFLHTHNAGCVLRSRRAPRCTSSPPSISLAVLFCSANLNRPLMRKPFARCSVARLIHGLGRFRADTHFILHQAKHQVANLFDYLIIILFENTLISIPGTETTVHASLDFYNVDGAFSTSLIHRWSVRPPASHIHIHTYIRQPTTSASIHGVKVLTARQWIRK